MPETTDAGGGRPGIAPSGLASPGVAPGPAGEWRPVQLGLTVFTLLAGIVAFATGLIVRQHLAATVLGGAGMVVGLYMQMISATRTQRIFLMAGVVPAFVGVCLGLAHGGFG